MINNSFGFLSGKRSESKANKIKVLSKTNQSLVYGKNGAEGFSQVKIRIWEQKSVKIIRKVQ
jgi:hypothetical protein